MGLLTSVSLEEDRRLLEVVLEGVCDYWDEQVTKDREIRCQVTESGMTTASLLGNIVFDGNLARSEPGPFKRAGL